MNYNVLKNRMENGTPFLLTMALARINFLADNLEITQEEADELTAIAKVNGVDVMPMDAQGRLDRLEQTQLEQDEALMELATMAGGI